MIHRIVLTGGPAGGKSSALPLIAEHYRKLGYDVYTVPEIPTFFHSNGVLLKLSPPEYHLALEIEAFGVHHQLETSFYNLAKSLNRRSLILTDRGLVDLKAYCADDKMWEQVISTRGDRLQGGLNLDFYKSHYNLVLHFTSTGVDAPQHFTNENNPARQCTPELAKLLDSKTLKAWDGHPNRIILDNSTDFSGKVSRAIDAIQTYLHK